MLVAPCGFSGLVLFLAATAAGNPWVTSLARLAPPSIPALPPRPPASEPARMNPGSRQSSIHHLAAELATCQPAALCESRTRHVQIPNAPCGRAPAAPDEASCASADSRPALYAAVTPAAARSIPPGCNRVRAAGQDATAPARSRPRGTPRLPAPQFPPSAPQTNRPAASLLHISAAESRGAARRGTSHSCVRDRKHSCHRGTAGTEASQPRHPQQPPRRSPLQEKVPPIPRPRHSLPQSRETAARSTRTSVPYRLERRQT